MPCIHIHLYIGVAPRCAALCYESNGESNPVSAAQRGVPFREDRSLRWCPYPRTHARTRTHTRSRAGSLAAATAARARASHHPRATCHLPARLHASGHREPSLSLTFCGRRSPQWLLRQRDAGDTPLRAGLPWRCRVTAGSTEASPASGGLWPAHTLVRSDSERDHRFTERLAFLAASSSLLGAAAACTYSSTRVC